MNRALIIVAKKPEAGRTKTRLSPPLSGEQAAALYHHFLLDTLELMQQVEIAQPVLAYTPDEAKPFFQEIAPDGFAFLPQVGPDLGERSIAMRSPTRGLGTRIEVSGSYRLAVGRPR